METIKDNSIAYTLHKEWLCALKNAGIKPISDDTCCKLLAIVYVYGGNSEAFTYNKKLLADVEYSKERLNIGGAEVADATLLPVLQRYIKDLENDENTAPYKKDGSYIFDKIRKSFAVKFMKERYNIDII